MKLLPVSLLAAAILAGCGATREASPSAEATVAPEVVPAPQAPAKVERSITVAKGATLRVRTTSTISSESALPGELFSARLEEPLVVDGESIVPKGARVDGFVANVSKGGRVKGVASLGLRVTKLTVDGSEVEVASSIYTKNAPASKKQDAVKVGIGAGIGAAVGAIAGGGKGAAVGAASGAGAGTAVVLATRGEPAVISAESVLTFRLTAPLTVTVWR